MKVWHSLFIFIMTSACFNAYSQTQEDASNYIKQGIELGNQKKYVEAAGKYKLALAIDPGNLQANYQMAFALFSIRKNKEALLFIDKATKGSDARFNASAFSLMGSIYQGTNQLPAAIAAYQNAIKADSSNQRIYYNLGIAHFRYKQYTDAENSFELAIKLDSTDAGSWRMYALAAFHQNKRAQALLGFCSFLILEPNSSGSAEAFGNLQNILSQGILKPEPGYSPTPILRKLSDYQNNILAKALTTVAIKKTASQTDKFAARLSAVFNALSAIPRDKNYSWYKLADYFAKLPDDQTAAFTRYVSQSAKPENAKWLKDNTDKATALQIWLSANKPGF